MPQTWCPANLWCDRDDSISSATIWNVFINSVVSNIVLIFLCLYDRFCYIFLQIKGFSFINAIDKTAGICDNVSFLKASPQYYPLFSCFSREDSCLKLISMLHELIIPVRVKVDLKTFLFQRASG